MPEPKLSRRKILLRGLGLGSVALGVDAFGIEPEWLDVERITVPIKGLAKAFDGYRISLFSDIHWPRNIDKAYIHRVVRKANAFDPDLVAIPGDLCDIKGHAPDFLPDLRGLFDGLKSRDGIIGTLGNHDHIFRVGPLRELIRNQTPIEIVENDHRLLTRGDAQLAVGGVGDLRYGIVQPALAFAGVPDDVPRILLSHNPDTAEMPLFRGQTRVDLQLSGHTHGGEIRFPLGPAPKIPSQYSQKFREGLVQGANHLVYVTRGVCSPRHIRFMCRPEVTYLTLSAA